MRIRLALCLWGLCLAGQGCTPLGRAFRTTVIQPVVYCHSLNCLVDGVHDAQLAKEAWERYQGDHSGTAYSPDFATGFKTGYADYLFAGGTGNPPPVPPRCYWNSCYETPEGQQAIRDWFAGFHEGAVAAKESGYRELVTIPTWVPPKPSSLPPPGAPPPVGPGPGLHENLPVAPQLPSPSPVEELPKPRPVPGPAGGERGERGP